MKIKDSVKALVNKAMTEVSVDIDIISCKKHGIKYKNHEIDATERDLFNTRSNKAAFEFLAKKH